MATVYQCDRCVLIGETQDYLTTVLVPATPALGGEGGKVLAPIEQINVGVCHDCLAKLRAFMVVA